MSNDPCISCGYSPSEVVLSSKEHRIAHSAKSGNKYTNGKGRLGWQYRAERQRYREKIYKFRLEEQTTVRRLTITRRYATSLKGKSLRPYDYDNLVWGFKPLVDELVRNGLFIDDSPKYLQRAYRQEKGEVNEVIILVEDLERGW